MALPRINRSGYFGKVPVTGDFVSRNVDSKTRDFLDAWLQRSMEASKEQLGDAWLNSFLTAPIWRFAINGQVETDKLVLGMMMPSVDKVGRYFPFLFLFDVDQVALNEENLARFSSMLDAYEELLLTALSDDFDLEYLDYQLGMITKKLASNTLIADIVPVQSGNADAVSSLTKLANGASGSLWWTDGSDHKLPTALSYPEMPGESAFASLLRDPDPNADLEVAWEAAKQADADWTRNSSADFFSRMRTVTVHTISHHDASGTPNTTFAAVSTVPPSITLCDGLYYNTPSALVSRMVVELLPSFWDAEKKAIADDDMERLREFISQKMRDAQPNRLNSALSFVMAVEIDGRSLCVLMAGDGACYKVGRHGTIQLLAENTTPDAPTIRKNLPGQYSSVTLELAPHERILIGTSNVNKSMSPEEITDCLSQTKLESAARAVWQNASIAGFAGNVALAVIERPDSKADEEPKTVPAAGS